MIAATGGDYRLSIEANQSPPAPRPRPIEIVLKSELSGRFPLQHVEKDARWRKSLWQWKIAEPYTARRVKPSRETPFSDSQQRFFELADIRFTDLIRHPGPGIKDFTGKWAVFNITGCRCSLRDTLVMSDLQ